MPRRKHGVPLHPHDSVNMMKGETKISSSHFTNLSEFFKKYAGESNYSSLDSSHFHKNKGVNVFLFGITFEVWLVGGEEIRRTLPSN